jgi:Mor family transcriptional regulator
MEQLPAWTDEITLEDIPPQHQKLAVAMDMKTVLRCAELMGGTYVYIPKRDALLRAVRNRHIRAAYKSGIDARALAIKYDLSQVQIYEIIKSAPQMDGQYSMFDEDDPLC